ncbi:MAG: hypothetical protein ACJAWO_002442 [Halieaceae bacterium]|jgi:hypothetical protein
MASCTKVSTEENLPEITNLQPQTMLTLLPVVHIEADPIELEYMMLKFSVPIKVSAMVTIYSPSKSVLVRSHAHIEIKGAGSASLAMKPIGVVFDQEFNNEELALITPKVIANGVDLGTIQNIRLRNSSQDYGTTMLKDLAFTELALRAGFDLELKYGRPSHVFINEEYYGLHNLRTEVDPLALSHLLHVDSSAITVVKMEIEEQELKFKNGNKAFAKSFIQAIKDEDLEMLKNYLDVNNFIDYIIYQDYTGNIDWPRNNARAYSVNGSKFRFLLFDLDLATKRTNISTLAKMEYMEDHISQIYQILLNKDREFKNRLDRRKKYWYTQLSPQLFNTIVDELAENIENEIPYLIAKRGVPENSLQWKINLDQLKRELERRDKFNRHKYELD